MGYTVAVDNPVTVLHPVRTVAGVLKTGEAANVTTSLTEEDGSTSGLAVTAAAAHSPDSGWVSLTFTPDAVGTWILEVTNPAGTDEAVAEYHVQVKDVAAITADSSLLLTTRARVKRRLWPEADEVSANTDWDDLLDDLISEVSDRMHTMMGRILPEQTYTDEYHDGTGTDRLILRQGPLVSVTSLVSVSYSDGGSGARSETTTTIDPYEYVEEGLRSKNHKNLAAIRLLGGATFCEGRQNYKITYVAGFSTVPEAVVRAATNECVLEYNMRDAHGLLGRDSAGGASINPSSMRERDAALIRAVAPWAIQGLA